MMRKILVAAALLVAVPVSAKEKTQDFGGAKPINPEGWFRKDDYPAAALRERRAGALYFHHQRAGARAGLRNYTVER